jgi:hypothetical protein
MQQLPVGWVNPSAQIVLGAGALIDPDILKREIGEIEEKTGEDIRHRLHVDYRAYIHWPWHARESARSDRHRLIGATGKGCSEALMARIKLRGQEDHSINKHADKIGLDVHLVDTEELLNDAWDGGAKIQLEGTQGQLLDLYLGPYPYTTHKQTGPGQWLNECGLSPNLPLDVVAVVRTFPIRVAGNSGPMAQEISWPILAREINANMADHGLPPIVTEGAICAFEEAVRSIISSMHAPEGSDGLDQHLWTADQRVQYSAALSQLHAEALATLSAECVQALKALFEMTTVTKKLRRIARLDLPTLVRSARQMRPSRVAITFANYMMPHLWNMDDHRSMDSKDLEFMTSYITQPVEIACGAPVDIINFGAWPEHFHSYNEMFGAHWGR